jgi:hypothetical protein
MNWWLFRLAGRAAVGMEVCRSKKLQVEKTAGRKFKMAWRPGDVHDSGLGNVRTRALQPSETVCRLEKCSRWRVNAFAVLRELISCANHTCWSCFFAAARPPRGRCSSLSWARTSRWVAVAGGRHCVTPLPPPLPRIYRGEDRQPRPRAHSLQPQLPASFSPFIACEAVERERKSVCFVLTPRLCERTVGTARTQSE